MAETENKDQNEEINNDAVENTRAESPADDPAQTPVADVDDKDVSDVAEPEHVDIEAQLEQAQAEIVKLKDAFLRAKAEEDNVRRRAEKEVSNARKFAVEGFAKELLSVHDSLKLALGAPIEDQTQEAAKGVLEGVEITLKQLRTALGKFGIEEVVPAAGDKLDPNLHQAMSMVESEEIESGRVINAIQSGFRMHERLLRPAMVVVAK